MGGSFPGVCFVKCHPEAPSPSAGGTFLGGSFTCWLFAARHQATFLAPGLPSQRFFPGLGRSSLIFNRNSTEPFLQGGSLELSTLGRVFGNWKNLCLFPGAQGLPFPPPRRVPVFFGPTRSHPPIFPAQVPGIQVKILYGGGVVPFFQDYRGGSPPFSLGWWVQPERRD